MTDTEKKLAFLLATSPYLDALDGKYEAATEDLVANGVVPVVRCENCTHQQKVWHDDKRMKEGGFFIYSCKLNDDPFVTHVVDGNPGEFCSAGKRRVEYTITTEALTMDEHIRFEDLGQEV